MDAVTTPASELLTLYGIAPPRILNWRDSKGANESDVPTLLAIGTAFAVIVIFTCCTGRLVSYTTTSEEPSLFPLTKRMFSGVSPTLTEASELVTT